eukprot:SAG31_NODE_3608_length_4068_cov_7.979854_1_plen_87_part_00
MRGDAGLLTLAQTARQISPGLPVHEALAAVKVPAEAATKARRLMATVGVETVLDLQLLAGAPNEAEELISELSASGLTVYILCRQL